MIAPSYERVAFETELSDLGLTDRSLLAGEVPAALASLAAENTAASHANALSLVKLLSEYYRIPWRVPYVVLEHEGGVEIVKHGDGVMQTTRVARRNIIPRLPRELKLALLERADNDGLSDKKLNAAIAAAFPRRLAVQIAFGVQELVTNLRHFAEYVALALIGYNAGAAWPAWVAMRGAAKKRPPKMTDEEWESRCRFAAALYQQAPAALQIPEGSYQVDANIPTWFRTFSVCDKPSGQQLIALQYLRRIVSKIHRDPPTAAPTWAIHRTRDPGSGPVIEVKSRVGALDKLYDPAKMRKAYRLAAPELEPIADDGLPLRAVVLAFAKMPL